MGIPTRGNRGWIAAVIGWLCFLGESADAKTLRHRATGFKVNAPSGYSLRAFKGIYTVRKGRDSATIMKVSSPLVAKAVAKSLATTAKMKRSRIRGGGRKITLTGTVGRSSVYIEIEGVGPTFTVRKYETVARKAPRKQARMLTPLTLRDVAFLRQIGRSARGGILSPFLVNIPMQRFSQGGATALVPAIPGWTYSGAAGGMDGSRAGQGLFAFGIFFPGQASSTNPGQVIVNDWARVSGIPIVIQGITILPGTEGVLGAGYNSATYLIRFSIQGISYNGMMTSGVTNASGLGLDWYFSFISARAGAFPGLGNTLAISWASWDPSGNQAARFNAALAAIRSTPSVPIDRDAFDRINSAWVEYIRR